MADQLKGKKIAFLAAEGVEVTDKDLAALRRAQRRLRDVFEYGTSGRDADAVTELNSLLEAYAVQPRIAGHDAGDWHMHVTDPQAPLADRLGAEAAMALVDLVRSGELPAIQVGGRGQWRVEKARFDQWIEKRHQETAEAVRAGASLD